VSAPSSAGRPWPPARPCSRLLTPMHLPLVLLHHHLAQALSTHSCAVRVRGRFGASPPRSTRPLPSSPPAGSCSTPSPSTAASTRSASPLRTPLTHHPPSHPLTLPPFPLRRTPSSPSLTLPHSFLHSPPPASFLSRPSALPSSQVCSRLTPYCRLSSSELPRIE
jgi:hypothetical protein